MTTFKYIGGKQYSDHADERDGVDMPDAVTMFGHKFVIDRPVTLKRESFRNEAELAHAVSKLDVNQYFKRCDDEAVPTFGKPRGKIRAVEASDAE